MNWGVTFAWKTGEKMNPKKTGGGHFRPHTEKGIAERKEKLP